MKYDPVHYHEYLCVDSLTQAQKPKSKEMGKEAHDEHLFIIVHQVYELWFKQMIHELSSILEIFKASNIDESQMGIVVARLNRMIEIQKILIDQIRVMETMTPLDFLEFRDLLYPASGFQSFQFRTVETLLGLKSTQRKTYNNEDYKKRLTPSQAKDMEKIESLPSLFECVEKWLERTPFLEMSEFDFWNHYQSAVSNMFSSDRDQISQNEFLDKKAIQQNLEMMDAMEQSFQTLLDEKSYNKAKVDGHWRLSYKSIHAALLIQLYRDQPILHLPFKLITCLLDLDELMTSWRYRHALMAKRMLGSKIGTGGSSGFKYLREATDSHKIFSDLFQLTTFFIPKSKLPELPDQVKKQLGFYYQSHLES